MNRSLFLTSRSVARASIAAVSALFVGCSATPYTGDVVSEATTPTGLNVIQTSSRSVLPGGGLAGEESELKTMTAKVESVSLKTRTLTLRTADDKVVPLKVGESVRNLAQVEKGDTVELDYFEAVEFEVRQPTAEEVALAGVGVDVAGRAPKGNKPAALVAGERVDILTIESIDKKRQLITLKSPEGYVTVKAKYPQNLKVVKVGDTVVVKTSELFAARVKELS
jgi:hypothetical protein